MIYVWYLLVCLCTPLHAGEQRKVSPTHDVQQAKIKRTKIPLKRQSENTTSVYITIDQDTKHASAQGRLTIPSQQPLSPSFFNDSAEQFSTIALENSSSSCSSSASSSYAQTGKNRICTLLTSTSNQQLEDEDQPGSPRPPAREGQSDQRACSLLGCLVPMCYESRKQPRPISPAPPRLPPPDLDDEGEEL